MALLRPQADQVHWLATVHNLTYTAKRSPTDSDSLPPPSSPFFTHTNKYIYKHCLWNPLLPKLAGRVRGCEKLNKSAPRPRRSKEYPLLQH